MYDWYEVAPFVRIPDERCGGGFLDDFAESWDEAVEYAAECGGKPMWYVSGRSRGGPGLPPDCPPGGEWVNLADHDDLASALRDVSERLGRPVGGSVRGGLQSFEA